MSSRQHPDFPYEQLQAAWLAAQNGGSQLLFGGGFEGAGSGRRLNDFDQFNRSSITFPRQPTDIDHVLRVVAQADHDLLIRADNEAYANALALHKGSQAELDSLRRAFEELVKGRSTPAQAAEASQTRGSRLSGIPRRLPIRKEECPNIKFWTRKQYEDAKNKKSSEVIRTTTGNTINLGFIEYEDGTPVTEAVAAKIRETARSVFAQFLQDGTAPAKWGEVSVVSQDFFFNVLAERFPYVAMCEDMWKAQLIATTCYPSWHRNNKAKLERNRFDREREERERVWIEQQLEHARQVQVVDISGTESKEELIDHADHLESRSSKRDLSTSQDDSAPEMRPTKKSKSTVSPASSSGKGKNPAPPKVLTPTSSLVPKQPSATGIPPNAAISTASIHATGPALLNAPTASRSLDAQSQINTMLALPRISTPIPSFESADDSTEYRQDLARSPPPPIASNARPASQRPNSQELSPVLPMQPSPVTPPEELDGFVYVTADESTSPLLNELSGAHDGMNTISTDFEGVYQPAPETLVSYEATLDMGNDQFSTLPDASALCERHATPSRTASTSVDSPTLTTTEPMDAPAGGNLRSLSPAGQFNAPAIVSPAAHTLFDARQDPTEAPGSRAVVQRETQYGAEDEGAFIALDFDEVVQSEKGLGTQGEHAFTSPSSDETTRSSSPALFVPRHPDEPMTALESREGRTAESLLALHHDVPHKRVRPTPRDPLTPTVPLDINDLFDKNKSTAAGPVRNPLAHMLKERIPSVNVAPDLTSLHEDPLADKENESPKTRGRGRPAGKTAQPDQLIKPTKDSLTARNLFALEYKEANRTYPTEAMWQNLEKAELLRLDNLSKERKAARSKAKAEAKAMAGK